MPRTGTARLVISVIDVNDNPPVFTGIGEYTIEVTEEQELVNGMLGLNVTATDADSDEVNGAVSYFIDGTHGNDVLLHCSHCLLQVILVCLT